MRERPPAVLNLNLAHVDFDLSLTKTRRELQTEPTVGTDRPLRRPGVGERLDRIS